MVGCMKPNIRMGMLQKLTIQFGVMFSFVLIVEKRLYSPMLHLIKKTTKLKNNSYALHVIHTSLRKPWINVGLHIMIPL